MQERRGTSAVRLKTTEARVFKGCPWVYRGEIHHSDAPPGAVVSVWDPERRYLGQGFFNPRSVIAVRMVTRFRRETVDEELFQTRVEAALRYRATVVGDREAYRVIYSESDGLPGLIVDRYGPMLVVECTSLGMARFLPAVVDRLVDRLHPEGVWERGDLPVRALEGLPRQNRLLYGRIRETVWVREGALTFAVDLVGGQKTGHFLDQAENRRRVAELARGRTVFDAFCHTGGFGLHCAAAGAERVVGIDLDREAIARARENAARNGLAQRTDWVVANAFDWLRSESERGARYDLGILDPPAFTKSRDRVAQARAGYKEINLRALKLIRPGGILVTCSCSYHLSEAEFIQVVGEAATDVHRRVRILEIRGQGPDHPVLPTLPESRYLKCLILAVE
ncbi:MAG: class I SAM-dependent rRNA methyltransferase [Firmicutes bacterium]|nr:class I SAM-dependent rRNA methyltransferase [Alicyclobacillaceae bacterium]MCL6496027.1 class I SAM-dependent rRNA methyltransferase [Bacillota bacterium]